MDNPNDSQPPPEKKIFVDEDWKAQVQAEKEQYEQEHAHPAPEKPQTQPLPLPPASLITLATTLGVQAMMALGLMPDPTTGKAEMRLDQARHFIDTLAVLQEKTEGNRTPEESSVLEHLLHELRMGYVASQQAGRS